MTISLPVIQSLPATRSPNRAQQVGAEELRQLFGIDVNDPAHLIHLHAVQARLAQMQTTLGSLSAADFRCVTRAYSGCGPIHQWEAFVTGHIPVYLCASAFENDNPDGRAATVIHEVAHLCGAMHSPEHYSPTCSSYDLQMGIAQAIDHAEHYACLVRCVASRVRAIRAQAEADRIMQTLSP